MHPEAFDDKFVVEQSILVVKVSLMHLQCRLISISNLNLIGVVSTERGKRD